MSASVLAALLGAGGIAGILGAIVTGLFSKRKLGAEATEVITKAATGVITNLQAEIDRQVELRQQMASEHRDAIATMLNDHNEEINEFRRVLQLHVVWDGIAIQKMGELGIELPPAPPLLPRRGFYPSTDSS